MLHRIVIVGAGAMGCLFAARLAEGGMAVTVVDVAADRLAMLGAQGVTLSDDSGIRTVAVQAAGAADVSGPVDAVMLFTKGMHSQAAIASVAHLAAHSPVAVTLQNGLGNAELLAQTFGQDRVIMGVTDFPADLEGPTHVSSHGQGQIWMGAFSAASTAICDALAETFNRCGLRAHVERDVRPAIWAKVAFNAALNSVATLTGLTNGGMDTPEGRRLIFAIADEVVATAHALDIAVDPSGVHAKLDFALTRHRAHRPSMLQDRIAGRRTEIESINGAVIELASTVGLAMPRTSAVADLVRMGERFS